VTPGRLWRLRRAVLAVLLLTAAAPGGAAAQQPGLSGYYLNLFTGVGESVIAPAGVTDFQRLRMMWNGSAGPLRLDAAYEHTLTLRQEGVLGAQLFTAAGTASGGDWLSLGGEIRSDARTLWRHRVDRLSVRIDLGSSVDLVIGRQPVSWATTLFLTPADPFSPFDPADPFREYRTGVDAARLRYYRGSFTQFEVVVRPARPGDRETLTLLGRVSTNRRGWDLGAWGGVVHDTFGAAAFLSGSVGLWALRAEGAVRDLEDRPVVRGTVGLDRTFPVADADLYVVVEYQRDGLGATTPDGLLDAARSRAFEQGEMQGLGRDVGALQMSYPVHPLVSVSSLVLGSLRDGSFIIAPGLGYSVSESMSLSAGAYFGVGEGASLDGTELSLGSEFGVLPRVGYLSASAFFW